MRIVAMYLFGSITILISIALCPVSGKPTAEVECMFCCRRCSSYCGLCFHWKPILFFAHISDRGLSVYPNCNLRGCSTSFVQFFATLISTILTQLFLTSDMNEKLGEDNVSRGQVSVVMMFPQFVCPTYKMNSIREYKGFPQQAHNAAARIR